MITINVPKVRGKMAERGIDITALSEQLGVSRNTLSNYLKSPGKMPYNVMANMATILCDNSEEATQIFFANDLRKT